jgi:hypothetical protein
MNAWEKAVNVIIDNLISNLNDNFRELLSANILYTQGQDTINQIDNAVVVSPLVGADLRLEPLPITLVKQFKDQYPSFLMDVFHARFVQLWNQCLNDIFSLFVDLHFDDTRRFEELKAPSLTTIRLDFSSETAVHGQIKKKVLKNFDLLEFSEKQKLINKMLNHGAKCDSALHNVKKNVLIRNAIQHHRKRAIDARLLKKLGASQIRIKDSHGKDRHYKEGDEIVLFIPEIYSFMSSMLFIGEQWRVKDD